ncbi:hypothetical protein DES36_1297 [Alkalibaculum bacchi]|uniref:Uncharacterized protein n=1 Tax=Alkalibaculum bacchi TaxID=645887 RepID=A0A366HWR1_9FIRM|nr:hypothetical protein DES36_1297 [Alkalibaculum bacchi]
MSQGHGILSQVLKFCYGVASGEVGVNPSERIDL